MTSCRKTSTGKLSFLVFPVEVFPFIYTLLMPDTGSVICNHTIAIPDDNGDRKKKNKLSAKNCQDRTEECPVPVPFYCFCFSNSTDPSGPAFPYG